MQLLLSFYIVNQLVILIPYLRGNIMRHIIAHIMELIRWISKDGQEYDRPEEATKSKQAR